MGLSKTLFKIDHEHIAIQGLRCKARLGVLDHERVEAQDIIVCAVIFLSFAQSGTTDALSDTLDYRIVYEDIKTVCLAEHTDLCEALLHKIAAQLFLYPQITKMELHIEKPCILPHVNSMGAGATFTRLLQ